jgi:hypothetical protein
MALLRCYDAGDQKDTCDSNLNANKAIKGLGGTSMADVSQPDFLSLSAKDPAARVPEGVVERVILRIVGNAHHLSSINGGTA